MAYKAWAWGANSNGELGDNTKTHRSTPVSVYGDHSFIKIDKGYFTTYAIDSSHKGWAWGDNTVSQLGNNETGNVYSTPVSIYGGRNFSIISSNYEHALGLDTSNKCWAWGSGLFGELGNNLKLEQSTPVSVYGEHSFVKVSAGQYFSAAIDVNGHAWTWGSGQYGQLGNNTRTSVSTPVSVHGDRYFTAIQAGNSFAIALDTNGHAWAWGLNGGQLGDNSTTSRSSPVSVYGEHVFTAISTKGGNTLALDTEGHIWAWGAGVIGVFFGVWIFITSSTPVSIAGEHSYTQIANGSSAGGSEYSWFALDSTGRVWSWGCNSYGQLGNNTTDTILTPASIYGGLYA